MFDTDLVLIILSFRLKFYLSIFSNYLVVQLVFLLE